MEKVYHFQTMNQQKLERSVSAKRQVKHLLKEQAAAIEEAYTKRENKVL